MGFKETILEKTAGARLFYKDHQSEIEIGTGIACFALSVITAARAGIKTKKIIDDYNKAACEAEVHRQEGMVTVWSDNQQEIVPYTEEDFKKELRNLKLRTAGKIAVTWAPSALGFAGGTSLVLHSHHLMAQSNIALAAALKTSEEQLKKYRDKNAEKIGEEKEQQVYDGQETEKKGKKEYVLQGTPLSKYARLMSKDTLGRSADWCNSSCDYNFGRVKRINEWANRQLKMNGVVTRREVYEALGFDVTNEDPDCSVDGWRLKKYGGKTDEGGIEIRIIDHIGGDPNNVTYVRDEFGDGYVRSADAFWIDLNCEGCILAVSTLKKLGGA